jgi:monofunctional biosynthetic peptidoglycan transglycosylase
VRLKPIVRIGQILLIVLGVIVLAPAALVLLYKHVTPPPTPLMLMRGKPIDYRWVPLARISPLLERSAVAAEDEGFCMHKGFDRAAIERAWERYADGDGGTLRGGSTISQQTAKNLLLWPGRTWLRKGLEAMITVYLETFWDKRRIIEVYLNIVEWAPHVYGAEAAAQYHFHKSARALDAHEAALLAAVLPNPREWSASKPGPYVRSRADVIEDRAEKLGPYARCL